MYLYSADYDRCIQAANLTQLIAGDFTLVTRAVMLAEEAATGILTPKFNIGQEFTDINLFSLTASYTGGQRIFDGNTPNLVHYVVYPYPFYNPFTIYNIGDVMFYLGSVYTALQPTINADLSQYYTYEQLPDINTAPDVPVTGPLFWGPGIPYSLPIGTPLTDPRWILGDNRSQLLVESIIDIAIYRLHKRISPRNIPEKVELASKAALDWIKDVNAGVGSLILPRKENNTNNRIRYGGNVKLNNVY